MAAAEIVNSSDESDSAACQAAVDFSERKALAGGAYVSIEQSSCTGTGS